MQKLHFEISIRARPEKVWEAIVDEKKFRQWTSAFNESSYFEGGWEQGDKIHFIGLNEKGEKEGMVAEIAENRKYSFISIRHLGYIYGDREDTTSDAVKKWAPAYENYTFHDKGNETRFVVDVDTEDTYAEMFREMWPRALRRLKEVAES